MNPEKLTNQLDPEPEETMETQSKMIKGFSQKLINEGLAEVRRLSKEGTEYGNAIASVATRIAADEGFSFQTAAEYLRSALAHEAAKKGAKMRNARKNTAKKRQEAEALKLMRQRGDEGIPDEEIFAAREEM
jgi:hypothetical protein